MAAAPFIILDAKKVKLSIPNGYFTRKVFDLTPNIVKDAPPGTANTSVMVPAINIKGRWLDEAGFAIGAKVRVRVCQGCLVMTIEE